MQVHSVEAVFKALNDQHVRYLVVGGLAVNAHGYVRLTNDIDLVLSLVPSNILTGLGALAGLGYKPRIPVTPAEFAEPENRARWIREKGMVVLQLWSEQHLATPVDIFVTEPFSLDDELARAARFEVAPGLLAPFVCKETLLKMKLETARPQDLEDARRLKLL
jgi:hypothetical protein